MRRIDARDVLDWHFPYDRCVPFAQGRFYDTYNDYRDGYVGESVLYYVDHGPGRIIGRLRDNRRSFISLGNDIQDDPELLRNCHVFRDAQRFLDELLVNGTLPVLTIGQARSGYSP